MIVMTTSSSTSVKPRRAPGSRYAFSRRSGPQRPLSCRKANQPKQHEPAAAARRCETIKYRTQCIRHTECTEYNSGNLLSRDGKDRFTPIVGNFAGRAIGSYRRA